MKIDTSSIILLQSFRNIVFDYTSILFAFIFSTIVIAIFAISLFIYFIWKKYKPVFLVTISIAVQAVILKIIKEVIARPRPDFALTLPMLPYSQYSFPSGHTAAAFLIAIVLSKYYPKYKYPLFIIAILTAISRLYIGLHYLTDIIIGAIIGVIIGIIFLYKEKEIFKLGEKLLKAISSIQRL